MIHSLAVLIFGTAILFGTNAFGALPGNVDGIGDVSLKDAIVALQISAGIQPSGNIVIQADADVDKDGFIGTAEAVYALQVAAGIRIQTLFIANVNEPVIVETSLLAPSASVSIVQAVLPDGSPVKLIKKEKEIRKDNDYTWTGETEGDDSSTVVLSVVDGIMFGLIETGGKSYFIQPVLPVVQPEEVVYKVVQKDSIPVAMPAPDGEDESVPEIIPEDYSENEDGSVIDILVLYTPQMNDKYKPAALKSLIQHFVDLTNQAYVKSKISTKLRLVHTQEYSYSTENFDINSSGIDEALTHIKSADAVEIKTARETYNADLVSLLRVHPGSDTPCGRAYFMTPDKPDFEPFAFSVVQVRSLTEATDEETPYYCSELTFAHEIGNNLGCANHDSISADNVQTINNITRVPAANFRNGCSYSISQLNQSFESSADTGSVSVTAGIGCKWTAVSNNTDWITIISGAAGTGNGTVAYSVKENTSCTEDRTGSITAAGKTFTVTQKAISCTYSISPENRSFPSSGGEDSITVTAQSCCEWTAEVEASAASWIEIKSGTSGNGNGTVAYSVKENTSCTEDRTGSITATGKTFTVTQKATSCTYSISPLSNSFTSSGGNGIVSVLDTPSCCTWTAVSNATSWLTVTSGASGTGTGTVSYSVSANTGTTSRTGTMTIAGKTFTVTQCGYSISPGSNSSFTSSEGTGSVSVTAESGCAWTAVSSTSWLTVTSGASGTGNGTVSYSVAANTSCARTGTINVAGKTFTVTQAGIACTYSISPESKSFTSSGGSGSISVIPNPSCCTLPWTAVSNVPSPSWLTVTSGASGTGTGTVSYSVAANTGTARTGTLTVAGKTFTVTQVFTNSSGMTFAQIPAGTFAMGSPSTEPGRDNDEIQHNVTLSKSFYMQTTEVTQGQWKAVMGTNPSYFQNCGDNCPVEYVTWTEVQLFITEMNKRGEGTYRLPTEAEWEYAARAGSTTAIVNGDIVYTIYTKCSADTKLDAIGWYCGNSGAAYSGCYNAGSSGGAYCAGSHPVAQKQANAWGLYDMSGNVWEWCQDWYGAYPSTAVTDPTGSATGSYRVIRGGGWIDAGRLCRSASRYLIMPSLKHIDLGFRLVLIR